MLGRGLPNWVHELAALLMISTLTMILPLIVAVLIWPKGNGTVMFPACYAIGVAITWLAHHDWRQNKKSAPNRSQGR